MRNKMVEQGFKGLQLWRKNPVKSSKCLTGLELLAALPVNRLSVQGAYYLLSINKISFCNPLNRFTS